MTHASSSLAVTVYCASSQRVAQSYLDVAAELGRLIAARDYLLVYGGGNIGLMGALVRAAMAHGGKVKGVILDEFVEKGYAMSGHEMQVVTDMHARKRGLVDLGDAYISLPGGFGTFEEVTEVIALKQLKFHRRPIVFVNTNGYFDPLLQQFDRAFAEGFIYEQHRTLYTVAATASEALDIIEAAVRGDQADRGTLTKS